MRAPVALVVVLLLAGVAIHPGGAVPDDRTAGTSAAGAADPAWTGTTIAVQVRPNGDATWTVTYRFGLPTDNDTAAFRRLAAEFEAGEAGPDPALYGRFVELASDETGREMAMRGVERGWRVDNGTGTLSLSFTWTNFARAEGDRVVLGDVFRTGSGTWLPELVAGQTLVVRAPPEYAVESATTGHRNGTFRFEGPRSFDGGVVNATFVPQAGRTRTPTVTTTSPTDGTLERLPPAGVGVVGMVVALLAAVLLLRGRSVPGPWDDGQVGASDGTDDAPPAAGKGRADGEPAPGDDPFADVDEDLLSDEERVEVLLEANGGRMKQGDIVKETGWSNAKVSQLLSSMADDERLDKLRIGRENLITLPDVDVGDVDDGD